MKEMGRYVTTGDEPGGGVGRTSHIFGTRRKTLLVLIVAFIITLKACENNACNNRCSWPRNLTAARVDLPD